MEDILLDRVESLEGEVARLRAALARDNHEITQVLGKALGYAPCYPVVSDVDDGTVCVGDHVAASIAAEAARRIEELRAEVERLRAAIRRHRDERGDDRCWLDDLELYAALGEGDPDPATLQLPPREDFLAACARFWRGRQAPSCHGRTTP